MKIRRDPVQEAVTTGWLSLGWTTAKPGPWKARWKESPDLRSMREIILKLLLICGCKFVDSQVASCVSAKVGCCELSRRAGSPLSGPGTVSSLDGVWSEPDEIRRDMNRFRCRSSLTQRQCCGLLLSFLAAALMASESSSYATEGPASFSRVVRPMES